MQPGDLGEHLLQLVEDRQQTLERRLVLVGMLRRQARQRREPLVPLRVVLHRARPERIEVRVDRHVQRRQVRVVPDDVELAQLRQRRRRVGQMRRRDQRRRAAARARPTPGRSPSTGRGGWTRRAGGAGRACTWRLCRVTVMRSIVIASGGGSVRGRRPARRRRTRRGRRSVPAGR